MTTVLYVHGGEIFSSHEKYVQYLENKTPTLEPWISWTDEFLKRNCDALKLKLVKPRFPCKENAKYVEWKIIFDKYVQAIEDTIIVIGFSLGALFLAKWLSENKEKNMQAAYLVAAPYYGEDSDKWYEGWELTTLSGLGKDFPVRFFASTTDEIVPLRHAEAYQQEAPHAKHIILNKTNHFFDEEFPELIEHVQENLA